MAKRSDQFQTIRTEGALLPPDILQSVGSLKVDGVSPASYHLPPGTKLNEAIAHSWSVLQKYWKGFQEARQPLDPDKTGTEVTNQHWLLPLFEELKYGRLTTVKSPEIDGRTYPIERFYADQPIHLIGCNLPLDRRTTGARGAATASPHSMMQEFLNRTEESLWGFLTNGLVLRVLRDNVSLSRQAYIEFDLEAMMEGEVYADFALLWMICHQSRIEAEKPQEFWLEKWSQLARDLGTRVLSDLRTGVAKAIEALGRGFLAHPRNGLLREKLQSRQLSTQDFYRQLLRDVYRLLFLFVAEDRELLHPTDADEKACELYDTYYSTRRLRELADQIRGSKHADLWQTLSLVFDALSREKGCPELGLSPLGSFLWLRTSTPDLLAPASKGNEVVEEPSLITNDELLSAVRALAYVVQDKVRRAVDYRNLGSEELGSVYESLLELHPLVNVPARTFELSIAAGNERKTTGSYYTPDSLVQCLLDSALDPVVEDRLKGKKGGDAEAAILDITVCDPACGSGHFLIAAAHRLARHLARVRTGESEPSPADYQHALRDVIGHCVYGVDINPMAVELCKVSLWMEAIEPGRPLSFLEHHIQCGNSLLGTTPRLLADGVPDDAFKPIEGDNKKICTELKRVNKKQRLEYKNRQGYLFSPPMKLGNMPQTLAQINTASDDSFADIAAKQEMYAKMVAGADYKNARLLADTWCSAFVWRKDTSDVGEHCPTERDYRKIEDNPHSVLPYVQAEVRRLAKQYQFFHWHLAFPDVFVLPDKDASPENERMGWNGGFDVVLGNPPWERIKLQEKEWFAERVPEVAQASNASARKKLIDKLKDNDAATYAEFLQAKRQADGESNFIRDSGYFPLAGRGDVNTYAVFSELNREVVATYGRVGCIVPTGIATDSTTKAFFEDLIQSRSLVSLFDFENAKPIFHEVHRSYKFSLLTLGGAGARIEEPTFFFFAHDAHDLLDEGRHLRMSADDIMLFNPVTRTCPVLRNAKDLALLKRVYRRGHFIESEEWGGYYIRLIDLGDHADWIQFEEELAPVDFDEYNNATSDGQEFARLYEAKLIHQFNHRYATFADVANKDTHVGKARPTKLCELRSAETAIKPRYWVRTSAFREVVSKYGEQHNWLLSYRDVARATDERTCISSAVPFTAGTRSAPCIGLENPTNRVVLSANYAAFCFDYVTRLKVPGIHLNYTILKQLPVLPLATYDAGAGWHEALSLSSWLIPLVLELTYTAWDLEAFALECGYDGPPIRWDEQRRYFLRCELDAAYFHLYLGSPSEWGSDSSQLCEMLPTPRDAVDYIMDTFPIVKRKDIKRTEVKNESGEVTQPGTYITKDTILEIYDEMQQAIETGQPYQTRLDPPPGPPVDVEGNFIPMAQWDESNWPEHVHESRNVTAK